MKAAIVDRINGEYKTIAYEDKDIICGEYFCDRCGDCLVCYGDDYCPYDSLGHSFVIYKFEEDEADNSIYRLY